MASMPPAIASDTAAATSIARCLRSRRGRLRLASVLNWPGWTRSTPNRMAGLDPPRTAWPEAGCNGYRRRNLLPFARRRNGSTGSRPGGSMTC